MINTINYGWCVFDPNDYYDGPRHCLTRSAHRKMRIKINKEARKLWQKDAEEDGPRDRWNKCKRYKGFYDFRLAVAEGYGNVDHFFWPQLRSTWYFPQPEAAQTMNF